MSDFTLAQVRAMDAADPVRTVRDRFMLPDGVLYLDGNSLGVLPRDVPLTVADTVSRQWGDRLIRSWNEGWIDAPRRVGAKIAPLIGARPDEVIACDSTSTNLFKLLVAALQAEPTRRTILSEAGNFPTDLHIAEGAVRCVADATLRIIDRDELAAALDDTVAIVLLTHVHYKTAERFDMAEWTARTHAAGARILWDLSHSVGAVPVELTAADADMAVGCGYKYLNGGPGAPAFLYVARRLQDTLDNSLSGWMGHARPFAFEDGYAPAPGMQRWLTGTPAILGLAALEAALDVWADIDRGAVAAKSAQLFDILATAGDAAGLECVTPRDPAARGSHVSFRHPEAYGLTQALIDHGVIGDFRDPDVIRFGLTPLYLSHEDVWHAGERLREAVADRAWADDRYRTRNAVT